MSHYSDGMAFHSEQEEKRLKEQYTRWIIEAMKDKSSSELKLIFTLMENMDDLTGAVKLMSKLIK